MKHSVYCIITSNKVTFNMADGVQNNVFANPICEV